MNIRCNFLLLFLQPRSLSFATQKHVHFLTDGYGAAVKTQPALNRTFVVAVVNTAPTHDSAQNDELPVPWTGELPTLSSR